GSRAPSRHSLRSQGPAGDEGDPDHLGRRAFPEAGLRLRRRCGRAARRSGGSSSGPGAAVAAGLVPFAIGSETSGSILTPSAFCGVSGLRPTYGLVPRHGAMALCWTLDKLGPMARSADDCALVLAAIAGPDPRDPTTDGEFRYPERGALAGGATRRFPIGVVKD